MRHFRVSKCGCKTTLNVCPICWLCAKCCKCTDGKRKLYEAMAKLNLNRALDIATEKRRVELQTNALQQGVSDKAEGKSCEPGRTRDKKIFSIRRN